MDSRVIVRMEQVLNRDRGIINYWDNKNRNNIGVDVIMNEI